MPVLSFDGMGLLLLVCALCCFGYGALLMKGLCMPFGIQVTIKDPARLNIWRYRHGLSKLIWGAGMVLLALGRLIGPPLLWFILFLPVAVAAVAVSYRNSREHLDD